jgi:hypothetical protein
MFHLTPAESEKACKFIEEQDAKVVEKQKESTVAFIKGCAEEGIAYYGATGGAYSYIFTPTSIGLVTVIRNNMTKEELTLTDFGDW